MAGKRPTHHPKATMLRQTLLLSMTLTAALLPWSSNCFAHPALPIPNARPKKRDFAPDGVHGGRSSTATTTTTAVSAKGKSTPLSGTPFRASGIARRLSSSNNAESVESLPPSQLESIVANAKSISSNMGKKMDLTNPTLRTQYLTAMTAGLAVSLAMVPEAVSFSCEL